MYKKENNSWLKHIDFVILDILCLQLAFILAYEIRVAKGIPYLNPLYENMAFVLMIFQLLVSFFGESFSGVLRRGFLLADGIGDTVRVSLSEEPAAEIPVARHLVDYIGKKKHTGPDAVGIGVSVILRDE